MRPRRVGCLFFGLIWTLVFGLTNFVMAVGDPVDEKAANRMTAAFWIEIAVLVVVGLIFYRREMKDGAL